MKELVYTVVLLGAAQGMVLGAVLARRRQNRLANRVLAGLVVALALMLALGYLDRRWGFDGYPHFIALAAPLPFLFAPLLYLYVAALTEPRERLHPRTLVHGLPFVGNLLFMAQGYYFLPGHEKLRIAQQFLAGDIPLPVRVMQAGLVVQAAAYLTATIVALRRYGVRIRDYFSDIHRIELRWLTLIVYGNAAVWCVVALATSLQLMQLQVAVVNVLRPIVQLGSAAMVFLIGYISLWQPDLFTEARLARGPTTDEPSTIDEPRSGHEPTAHRPPTGDHEPGATLSVDPQPPGSRAKYTRNRLEPDEAAEIAAELTAVVADAEAYRDPALTLQTLADRLGVPRHTLSQVLNTHLRQSFYNFVNGHRAEALKAALARPELADRPVLDLAFEAGFNSKSTTNSVFKKHTGLTPSEFRRQALAGEHQ